YPCPPRNPFRGFPSCDRRYREVQRPRIPEIAGALIRCREGRSRERSGKVVPYKSLKRDNRRTAVMDYSSESFTSSLLRAFRELAAVACITAIAPGNVPAMVMQADQNQASADTTASKLPAAQLDSLVAPIALYPDPLLTQTL